MASEAQDSLSVIEAYKVQFERVRHLDHMALLTFVVIAALELSLFAAHVWIETSIHQGHETLGIGLLALALAAGGAHAIITNTGDYWITFVVIAQLTRGLGLVQRGIFPVSLLAHVPVGWGSFFRRLIGGFRGPFLIVYITLGWYSVFMMLGEWMVLPLAFVVAILAPVALATGSALFSYQRMEHQMVALRKHDELVEASRNNVVASHCDLAEALLQLDPPRLFHAQKQYELALEIEPDNPRAMEGLQRVLAWKSGERRPQLDGGKGISQSI